MLAHDVLLDRPTVLMSPSAFRRLVTCPTMRGPDDAATFSVEKRVGAISRTGIVVSFECASAGADVEVEGLDRQDWHIWPLTRGSPVGLCPLPGTALFQLTAKAERIGPDIESAVHRATGHRIVRVSWSSIYQPSVRMVNRFRVGRVFLAGDAAHVHPPTGGQGLNTGVQDAYNLGWKLAHVLGGGPNSLLDTYDAERLPIAAAVLGLSKRLYQTRSIKRGDATDQLALHYRTSSLSTGAPIGNLHPGDRMPDGRLKDNSRLFDHFRGSHATEIVTPDGPRILIRPDGYIAHIGTTHFAEYAGEPTREIRCTLPNPSGR